MKRLFAMKKKVGSDLQKTVVFLKG